MEEIGISELTPELWERFCELGEKTAREHILSKVSYRKTSDLNMTVDSEGAKPVTMNVDLELSLSPT